jgi:uncharacterized protein (DUF305 family)
MQHFKGGDEVYKNYSKCAVVATLFVIIAATLGIGCKAKEGKDSSAAGVNSPAPAASSMAGDGGMMSSSPNAANAPFDLQFIDTMTAHHQGAIDMAQTAESKAQKTELKSFARKIVEDQQREIAQMKQWRDKWYSGRPQAMNMEMPGMMDSMKGMNMDSMKAMTGADFERMFLDMMIAHHQGAVAMAKEALNKSEHSEVKNLAQQIIDAQQKEIEMMKKWKAAWGGAK